ncbi:hypothetical protein Tco_0534840 [Tanacetum coccineum]
MVMLKVSPWEGVIRFGKRGSRVHGTLGGLQNHRQELDSVGIQVKLPDKLRGIHKHLPCLNLMKSLSDENLLSPLEEIQHDEKICHYRRTSKIMDRNEAAQASRIPMSKVIKVDGLEWQTNEEFGKIEMDDLPRGFGRCLQKKCYDAIDLSTLHNASSSDGQSESMVWTLEDIMRECVIDFGEIGGSSLIGPKLVQETTDKEVLIKEKLKAARDHQKSYADNRRKPLEFEVGDHVLLKVSPWKGVICFGKRCLADASLHVSLDEIKVGKTLCFVEEPIEIMDHEVKSSCLMSLRDPGSNEVVTQLKFFDDFLLDDARFVLVFVEAAKQSGVLRPKYRVPACTPTQCCDMGSKSTPPSDVIWDRMGEATWILMSFDPCLLTYMGSPTGMSKRKFVIVCHEKVVEIPLEGSRKLRVQGERTLGAAKALMNAKVDEPKVGDISVVMDFGDVFPEDLPGLPPQRQVEFRIDLVHEATLVAKSPYRLAPLEMQELSKHFKSCKTRVFIDLVHYPEELESTYDTIRYMIILKIGRAYVIDFGGSYQLSIRCAPFEALYGRKCRSPVIWAEIGGSSLIGPEIVQEMTNKVVLAKEKPKAVGDHQKSYVDFRRKPLEYVGDSLLLKVTPWKGVVHFGKKGKLTPRYVGPFEILERISLVAYRLRLPEELNSMNDTFHVSNLRKCLTDANLHVPLNEIIIDKTLRFVEEPVQIMDREIGSLKRSKISLVKVRWNSKRGPKFTWECEDHMKSKYPWLFVDCAV